MKEAFRNATLFLEETLIGISPVGDEIEFADTVRDALERKKFVVDHVDTRAIEGCPSRYSDHDTDCPGRGQPTVSTVWTKGPTNSS